jgi:hypothetical protein
MTISDEERDELALAVRRNFPGWMGPAVSYDVADAVFAEGYRKPRTITTVEELAALPTEAARAAVKAAKESFGGDAPRGMRAAIHAAMEAAAPYMLAAAWDEGYAEGWDVDGNEWANPYRSQA